MAKSTKRVVKISDLVSQGEAARMQLGRSHVELKRKVDVPSILRESLSADPTRWIGGSAALGLAGSLLLLRKKKSKGLAGYLKKGKKKRGLFAMMLGMILKALKPAAKAYAKKLLKSYFKNQITKGYEVSPRRGADFMR